MQVRVETYTGHSGMELLRQFRLDGREIEVSDNLDQWPGGDYHYFKVRGGDGNLYILRLDEESGEMFQSAQSEAAAAAELNSGKRPSGHV